MGRRLELGDLTDFVMVSNPQISPDLGKVAFTVARSDDRSDDYSAAIWIVNRFNGEPVCFLNGKNSANPRWSADGRQMLFLSKEGLKEGEEGNALWISLADGRGSRMIAKLESGFEQPHWSSDGEKIFFLSAVGEPEKDVKVLDTIPIWSDALGFTYNKRKHLHQVDVASGVIEKLTEGGINVVCAAPSNNGELVAYAASTNELDPRMMDIILLDLGSGEHIKIAGGYYASSLCWSPDDSHLAFLGSDLSSGYSTHTSVWMMPAHVEKPENLTLELDRGCDRRVYYDLRGPFAGMPFPVWDGGYIYFPLSDGGRFNLYRINPEDREVEPAIEGDFSIEEFSVRNGIIAYTRVTSTEPAEVYLHHGAGEKRLATFNHGLTSKLDLARPERFQFQASDGQMVEGWILRPNDLKDGERAPAILDVHGGPKSKFGDSLMFEHQLYAAEGFGVIYINPRGSDGYSQEFADIRHAYGSRDYKDIMEGVEFASSNFGFLDGERIGVTGLSYGGFMTNWIVTHTDRFRAAISQNGICSWNSFFGTTDIGFHFTPDQVGGDPWSNEKGYREMSPITFAPKVTTPIMFVHSHEDYRCWIDQSIMFSTALKYLGKKTRFTFFMEGSHSFRSLSRPSIRKKRLEHMVSWFKEYLK